MVGQVAQIAFLLFVFLIVALAAIAIKRLLLAALTCTRRESRLVPGWWERRHFTTRLFLLGLLITFVVAVIALGWGLAVTTAKPYRRSEGVVAAYMGLLAILLALLTAILGLVALVRLASAPIPPETPAPSSAESPASALPQAERIDRTPLSEKQQE